MYCFFGLGAAAAVCVFCFVLMPDAKSKSDVLVVSLPALGFLLISASFVALAFHSRLTIRGDLVSVRYPLQTKSATLSELDGYREVTSRNGSFTILYRNSGKKAMYILSTFGTDDFYTQWISRLRNLDKLSISPS